MTKTPKELALLAAKALSDKKGREIQVLEIADLTTLADYFVLATGSSNTQINALVAVCPAPCENGTVAAGRLRPCDGGRGRLPLAVGSVQSAGSAGV